MTVGNAYYKDQREINARQWYNPVCLVCSEKLGPPVRLSSLVPILALPPLAF